MDVGLRLSIGCTSRNGWEPQGKVGPRTVGQGRDGTGTEVSVLVGKVIYLQSKVSTSSFSLFWTF